MEGAAASRPGVALSDSAWDWPAPSPSHSASGSTTGRRGAKARRACPCGCARRRATPPSTSPSTTASPWCFRAGTIVASAGGARALSLDEVRLEPVGAWTSLRSGARYPARWRLHMPELALELEVTPVLADQELDVGTRYWEGAVTVSGAEGGRAVSGRGYLEMVGYGP